MTFDKEMNLDPMNSGIVQVSTANALGQLSRTAIAPRKDGYFYTYVTNRSAGKVHFDNMVIKRWAPQVRVTYDYYAYGLTWEDPRLPGSPESIHDHCYQDKEFQWAEFTTGHGLALHDFHARMYDGATGRWLVPDPAAQFANPYLAMGNNPVISMDPDGKYSFSTLTNLAQGIKSGISNLWAHHLNGESISLKQGIGYFTQGFISGMANSYLGKIVPRLNTLKAPGKQELMAGINSFTTVLSAIGAGIDVATTGNWNRFGETGKILLGRSYVDENRTWAGGIWQGLSRNTWEKSQTFVGFNYMMLSSAFRRVDIGYYNGSTVGRNVLGSGGAVSLGNFISTSSLENDEEVGWGFGDGSYTTMHEYGHYLQSQIYGPLYLPKIGSQSSIGRAYWTEHDANFRSAKYLKHHYGFEWRSDYYPAGHPLHRYSYLPSHEVNPEWYEYASLIFLGSINFILP